MSEAFKLLYVNGQQLGKAMAQAQDLAERARGFTKIEIEVIPSPELGKLQAENARLRAVADAAYDWSKVDRSDESWARMLKALRAAGYPKEAPS